MSDETQQRGSQYHLSLKGDGISIEKKISQDQALRIVQVALSNSEVPFEPFKKQAQQFADPLLERTKETVGEFLQSAAAHSKHEQIAAIGYFITHREHKETFTKDDVKARFRAARIASPQNFHRDFSVALQNMWIAEDTSSTGAFYLTRTGEEAVKSGFSEKTKKRTGPRNIRNMSTKPGAPKEKFVKARVVNRSEAKILRDLDLNAAGNKPSLDDFFADHSTAIDAERNVVFIQYLADVREIKPVTEDHVLTCYQHLGLDLPAIRASLKNSSKTARGAYLMSSNPKDLRLSVSGLNLIRKLKVRASASEAA